MLVRQEGEYTGYTHLPNRLNFILHPIAKVIKVLTETH